MEKEKFEESKNIIKSLIKEGNMAKPVAGSVDFFMKKSKESVTVASRLSELEKEEDLPANLWIINASYYSMFFAATALLARYGYKIKTEIGIHKLTYHALVYFFIIEKSKLDTVLLEQYQDAVLEAEELLQLKKYLVQDYNHELSKRKIFTYDLGKVAEENKANTSLKRAKNFVSEVEKLL